MYNQAPNGIRYGVFALNHLDQDIAQELWFGPGAVDVSYMEAYNEAKKEAASKWDDHLEQAHIAAAEVDPNMSDTEHQKFISNWFDEQGIEEDEEQFVEDELEEFSDMCIIDEPFIEGEYEGVKYQISWLGGAPLLSCLESPHLFRGLLCSPCVPGAVDGDSPDPEGTLAYGVPPDWIYADKDQMTYREAMVQA